MYSENFDTEAKPITLLFEDGWWHLFQILRTITLNYTTDDIKPSKVKKNIYITSYQNYGQQYKQIPQLSVRNDYFINVD